MPSVLGGGRVWSLIFGSCFDFSVALFGLLAFIISIFGAFWDFFYKKSPFLVFLVVFSRDLKILLVDVFTKNLRKWFTYIVGKLYVNLTV